MTSVGKISNLFINIKEVRAGLLLLNQTVFKTGGLAKTLVALSTLRTAESNILGSFSLVTFQKSEA